MTLPQIGLAAVLEIGAFLEQVKTYIDATGLLDEETDQAANNMNESWNFAANAISVAVGQVMAQAFQTGIQAIEQFVQTGVDATSKLQDMRLSLENLAAAEIKQSGAANDMNEALALAGPVADKAMQGLKELSLASPFEYKDILSVFQLNQAFGQTIDMSLKLTKAITDISAAKPGIPGMMQRVAYNFSQMASIGKITMMDVRQLSMAGLNLAQVFQEAWGQSIKQVNADLASGKKTFKDVSEALVTYVDANFGGAAKRMSRTFSGLQSSIKDLAFFTYIDVFGQSLTTVTNKLADFFDMAMEFVQKGGLQPLGIALSHVVDMVVKLGEHGVKVLQKLTGFKDLESMIINLAAAFEVAGDYAYVFFDSILSWIETGEAGKLQGIADFFDETFGDIATDAVQWGIDIIGGLAQGIYDGMVAVFNALAMVGNEIAGLLESHSPPKLLPDLTKWGTAAINAYLDGWKLGDYTMFSEVADAIASFIRSFGELGIGEADVIPRILGSRAALQEAINMIRETGSVTEEAVRKITSAVGVGGATFEDYIRSMLQMTYAEEKLKAAQEELNDVTEYYDKILKDLNSQLNKAETTEKERQQLIKLNKALATGKLTEDEKAKVLAERDSIMIKQKIRDVTEEKNAAVEAAKLKVDAAKLEYENAKAIFDLNKERVAMITEQNALIKEQTKLLEKLAKQNSEYELPKPPVPDLTPSTLADDLRAKITAAIDKAKDAIRKKMDEWIGSLKKQWEESELGKAVTKFIDEWKPVLEDFAKFLNDTVLPAISGVLKWIDEHPKEVKAIVNLAIRWLELQAAALLLKTALGLLWDILVKFAEVTAIVTGIALLEVAYAGLVILAKGITESWNLATKAIKDFLTEMGKFDPRTILPPWMVIPQSGTPGSSTTNTSTGNHGSVDRPNRGLGSVASVTADVNTRQLNGSISNVSNVTNITVNPTYQTYQSPASIRYDVGAALAVARM